MTRRFITGAAVSVLGLVVPGSSALAKNLLSADGPGGTYELIRTAYTTELPDCGHMVPHITEEMDAELKKNVFVFHAHVAQDDDRCGATDRQRTEIRGKAGDIIANNGETVYYRWKFKLPAGFQGTPSFTHIFQIKSDQAAPVMTLTPRTSTMAIDGRIGARGVTNLSKFIGVWVVVDLKILFSNDGRVEMKIRKLAGGEELFNYAGAADMWDDGANPHDPKWGIYRSLNNAGMLRDEQVRFADFCVSKQSASECDDGTAPPLPPSDAGTGTPEPDAGTSTPEPDAGTTAPTPDAGTTGGTPDAKTGGSDTKPTPSSMPDASSGGSARADARPSTGGEPEPEPDPTPPTAARNASSGCSVGPARGAAGGAAAALGLLACALGLLWKRRRR